MNVVDSSGWLEYFAGGPNANFFAKPIEATAELVVPTLSLYEVFKKIAQQRGEGDALQAVAVMQQGKVVELSSTLALSAAKVSMQLSIPMADSVILATARAADAVLWTQDADFATVPGVRYVAKK
ncbi:MAG: VapC toxin family PIN domain ribonuclease [Acidobacterium sp.]|nr:type II toxin-antitoxin system VapC family toxin [Acidobacteriota bacterium]PHY11738.1 MAG: VapC toxin family PIN domain ribonuclease [Acidobacterium sp.]